jgi:hypothetical protein
LQHKSFFLCAVREFRSELMGDLSLGLKVSLLAAQAGSPLYFFAPLCGAFFGTRMTQITRIFTDCQHYVDPTQSGSI